MKLFLKIHFFGEPMFSNQEKLERINEDFKCLYFEILYNQIKIKTRTLILLTIDHSIAYFSR